MGIINTSITSIARDRAKSFRDTEKISSEVQESVVDEMFEEACAVVCGDEIDNDDVEISDLLELIPDEDDECEDEEVENILSSPEEVLDIDDIVGATDDDDDEYDML